MYTKSVISWSRSKIHCSCWCHFKAVYLLVECVIKLFCQIVEKSLVLACGINYNIILRFVAIFSHLQKNLVT